MGGGGARGARASTSKFDSDPAYAESFGAPTSEALSGESPERSEMGVCAKRNGAVGCSWRASKKRRRVRAAYVNVVCCRALHELGLHELNDLQLCRGHSGWSRGREGS